MPDKVGKVKRREDPALLTAAGGLMFFSVTVFLPSNRNTGDLRRISIIRSTTEV